MQGKPWGLSEMYIFFILLTVCLEGRVKSKQINVYWAVKARPSQGNNVLAVTSPNSSGTIIWIHIAASSMIYAFMHKHCIEILACSL